MSKKKLYLWLGILITIFVFFILELINPFLFLDNDNFSQFAPVIIHGSEQLFSGNFPSVNLHQLMGSKVMENGTYAIFYPGTIISYFFAHYLFGNDLLIFEIFALLHFVFGFVFMFLFINTKTKNELICFLAALAFTFSGYFQLTKVWYYVAPLLIFLPLIFYFNDKLKKQGISSSIILGLLRGTFFYSGNVQYFVYAVLFEFIYFLFNNYQEGWKEFPTKFKKYLFSWFLTLIIVLPLLWAQLQTSKISARGSISPLEYLLSRPALPTDSFFGSIIFPFLLGFSGFLFRYAFVQYSGTLFALLFFGGGVILLAKYKKESFRKVSPLFWLGLIAMILSWGVFGILYSFGLLIPFFNSFQGPYKIIPFVNFFMISFGAIIANKLINKKQVKKYIGFGIFIFLILLFSNVLFVPTHNTHSFHETNPLDKNLYNNLDIDKNQRFITVLTNTSYAPKIDSNIVLSHEFSEADILTKNFATYYNLDHLGGYEPFRDKLTSEKISFPATGISNSQLNLTTLREYGVKYIILPKTSKEFHTELSNLKSIYENENFVILEQPNPRTYVFISNQNIPYERKYNGFEFKTNFPTARNVTVNLLYKDNYIAKINGKEVPFYEDDLGRIIIPVGSGENFVEIFYYPKDFMFGVYLSMFLIILFLIGVNLRKKLHKLYDSINFKGFFIFIGKHKWKLLILVIFISIILIFNAITSPSNMENLIQSKFGVQTEIQDLKLNLVKGEIIFSGIAFSTKNKEIFTAKNAIFDLDYKQSLKNTLSSKKPQVVFKKVSLSEIMISANIQEKEDSNCGFILETHYPKSLNLLEEFKLSKQELILENVLFVPMNKAFFSFSETEFNLSKENLRFVTLVEADIKLERYLHGEINMKYKIDSEHLIKSKNCIVFPLENKNNVFY